MTNNEASFRLPDTLRLGTVRLQIADLARSLRFYQEVLGLRVLNQSAVHAMLGAWESEAPLVELHERPAAVPVPRRGRLGLYHYAILLPDRAALGRFIRHLADTGTRAGASDHLVSEALYLQDPDGLGIEVYADRPRSTWRYQDRQLLMATEPLNMADVVQAAGGQPWTGMPRGTCIGHLHLHVGNLEQAAAFYHTALGLDKVVWSYPGALFLSAGGYHHHLGVNTWAAGAARPGDGDARLLEWEILLPDVDAVGRAVVNLGEHGEAVSVNDNGSCSVTDPWGTRLVLRARDETSTRPAIPASS